MVAVMKNIKFYTSEKYNGIEYKRVEEHIYKTKDNFLCQDCYVTSLCFEQEPELGEGTNSSNISQYPLEDILDRFYVAVEDFYESLNDGRSNTCVLEFSGESIDNLRGLISIVGKHVYNQKFVKDGKVYVNLVIE